MPEKAITNGSQPRTIKQRLNKFFLRFRSLQGDPHYVALGMAIGVFVALTPTIPLHMVIAIGLALVLRASKPAALIGVWFSNPLTIAPFYYGSYKLGMLMLGRELAWSEGEFTIHELLRQGLDVTVAMIAAGAVLGVVPAVVSYFITLFVFRSFRARQGRKAAATEKEGHPARISVSATAKKEQERGA